MSLIIFPHGKESGPYGSKISILMEIGKKLNFQTESIDYRKCKDVNERVDLLRERIQQCKENKIILVGSSMGGYVFLALLYSNLNGNRKKT